MKHFFKGIFVLLSFLIVSCTKLPPQTIQGTWQNERTVRTDLLSNPEDENSVFARFDTRQKIHLFPQFVNLNGTENMAFSYALEQNPAIKKERADLNYSLHPTTLYLQSEGGTLDAFSAQEN